MSTDLACAQHDFKSDQTIGRVSQPLADQFRVLVVDDDRDTADSFKTLIELLAVGCEVRTAYTGADGLEAAGSFLPNLIIVDIALPGLSGLDVARQLKVNARHQGTVLVALSGYHNQGDACHEAGFDHYFIKPLNPSDLEELLRIAQKAQGPIGPSAENSALSGAVDGSRLSPVKTGLA
jgi:CheY-like chemotaxis protein